MKLRTAFTVVVLYAVLVSWPAVAQQFSTRDLATAGMAACGNIAAEFKVKRSAAQQPPTPDAGKALVYFVEEDLNTQIITHTTRVGIDGQWMGATYGSSYTYFMVDPGVHHLCANTQIGTSTEDGLTALAHFTAEAGSIYYFEMKNVSMMSGPRNYTNDATLAPLDSDEGKYMILKLPFMTSLPKK